MPHGVPQRTLCMDRYRLATLAILEIISASQWVVRPCLALSFTRLLSVQQGGCCASQAHRPPVLDRRRSQAVSMTSDADSKPIPYDWEGLWSKGVGKGAMWDKGVVSPAVQNLLDEGEVGSQ